MNDDDPIPNEPLSPRSESGTKPEWSIRGGSADAGPAGRLSLASVEARPTSIPTPSREHKAKARRVMAGRKRRSIGAAGLMA
jgi:hypothetical protein